MNDDIRNTSACTLASLVKSAKKGNLPVESVNNMATKFIQTLWKAIKTESETETMVIQTQAIKEIIEEIDPFMQPVDIEQMTEQLMFMFKESDERKVKNEKMIKERDADEEEDEDELDLVKEEN